LITVHPGHVSPAALSGVNIVVVLGAEPQGILAEFARAIEREPPNNPPHDSSGGEAWVWFCEENRLIQVRLEPSRSEHHRLKRKYAEGELSTERSFYFRGPRSEMNLRAQDALGDEEMADQIESIEQDVKLQENDHRERVKQAILEKYTSPK
jgi:hypothetical protein